MSRRARWARAGLMAGLLGAALVARAQGPEAPAAPAVNGATAPAAQSAAPIAATVKITIIAVPTQKRVFVYWGKKRLGMIAPHQPLVVQRPRDSGPLDLIIQCQGFLPVQTRANTFGDTKLAVKLTPVDQKMTLLGYREEVPPPPLASPDGGVAAPATPLGAVPLPPGVAAAPPGRAPFAAPDSGVR
jgi:hypothetical protein